MEQLCCVFITFMVWWMATRFVYSPFGVGVSLIWYKLCCFSIDNGVFFFCTCANWLCKVNMSQLYLLLEYLGLFAVTKQIIGVNMR